LLDRFAAEYGITHVVLDEPLLELHCPRFASSLFADDHYAVIALTPGPEVYAWTAPDL